MRSSGKQIVDVVRGFALTPPGAARLAELEPQSDTDRASQLLTATAEGVKYLDANPAFSLNAPADLDTVLAALAVEGRALEPAAAARLAEFLDSIALTCATIRRVNGAFPTLKALAENCGSFKNQIGEVRSKIDPSGEMNDNASRSCRASHTAAEAAITPALDARIVSSRQGYVPLSPGPGRQRIATVATCSSSRLSTGARFPGIIHGSSGIGRASISSRSAQSRSTTRLLRSSSKSAKRCIASWAPHRRVSTEAD